MGAAPHSTPNLPQIVATMMLMQRSQAPSCVRGRAPSRRVAPLRASASVDTAEAAVAAEAQPTRVAIKAHGAASVKGTVRKTNEDRFDVKVCW